MKQGSIQGLDIFGMRTLVMSFLCLYLSACGSHQDQGGDLQKFSSDSSFVCNFQNATKAGYSPTTGDMYAAVSDFQRRHQHEVTDTELSVHPQLSRYPFSQGELSDMDLCKFALQRIIDDKVHPPNEAGKIIFLQSNEDLLHVFVTRLRFWIKTEHYNSLANRAFVLHPEFNGTPIDGDGPRAKNFRASKCFDTTDQLLYAPVGEYMRKVDQEEFRGDFMSFVGEFIQTKQAEIPAAPFIDVRSTTEIQKSIQTCEDFVAQATW